MKLYVSSHLLTIACSFFIEICFLQSEEDQKLQAELNLLVERFQVSRCWLLRRVWCGSIDWLICLKLQSSLCFLSAFSVFIATVWNNANTSDCKIVWDFLLFFSDVFGMKNMHFETFKSINQSRPSVKLYSLHCVFLSIDWLIDLMQHVGLIENIFMFDRSNLARCFLRTRLTD